MSRVLRWLAAFAMALGLVHMAQAQTTVRYIHTDVLGSVVAMTDENRVLVERREYEPYGQQLTALKDGPGYTGHVQDTGSGLTYMQQRYFDAELGTFLSVDPIAAQNQPTTQFHRYRYGNSNPYANRDPDGRKAANNMAPIGNTCSRAGGESCTGYYGDDYDLAVASQSSRQQRGSSPRPADADPDESAADFAEGNAAQIENDAEEMDGSGQYPSTYEERYLAHLDEHLINVGPYATTLLTGLWPKSLVPRTGGRGAMLGSKNPLTSVPRALNVPGSRTVPARVLAGGVGLATVAVGFYNVGVFGSGLFYASDFYNSAPEE